jgi:hypothetical protein
LSYRECSLGVEAMTPPPEELRLHDGLMDIADLPRVDEHATTVAAGVDDVWRSLTETLDRALSRAGAATYARAVGCADCTASGPRPLAAGSTMPGFRVVRAVPGSELALAGRHRFSSYTLIFRLERVGSDRSHLRAETRAAFPGLAGGLYRLLVIGSGGHVVAVRRLLSAVQRRSEPRVRSRT